MKRSSRNTAAHAPEPHLVYHRLEESVTEGAPALEDGPMLFVGQTGVFVVPVSDSGEGAVADAPGGTLYRFPRRSELPPETGRPTGGGAATRANAAAAPGDAGAAVGAPVHVIATFRGEPVYAAAAGSGAGAGSGEGQSAGPALAEVGYRELYGAVGDDELALVGRAIQIVRWDEETSFCPRCGSPTDAVPSECVKRCPECRLPQYPRLAPAMIVGVVREGKLLLGQSPRFRGRFHSILAGFLEPGESAEECVRREVYEEVGISVRNIRYFGSQPWPFPHSLMLGFTAEHESGELAPDPAEIIHADWYSADELPNVPGEVSISGRIISWFRREYG